MAQAPSTVALHRRSILRAGAAVGGGLFQGLLAATPARAARPRPAGYGPLRVKEPCESEVAAVLEGAPVLMLPRGFHYTVLSASGLKMTDGYPTPHAMDGMTAVVHPSGQEGVTRLIRNHEDRESASSYRGSLASKRDHERGPRLGAYDGNCGGGTTSLDVAHDPSGVPVVVSSHWSLVGTLANCSGGVTPWSTWLTCEEDAQRRDSSYLQPHGYVFEVPADTAPGYPTPPIPLTGLGRFLHEAAAVDPATGIIYLTEDNSSSDVGFYRWVPPADAPLPGAFGDLAALHARGKLQSLKVVGREQEPLYKLTERGTTFAVEWVDIPNPNSRFEASPAEPSVVTQGKRAGAAIFRKLEGAFVGDGGIYFVASTSGSRGAGHGFGQLWFHDPIAGVLRLVHAATSLRTLDAPDNVCITPRGGILLCEDGDGAQFLRGIDPSGGVFDFARNVYNDTELAGACFSPGGDVLFVNIFGASEERRVNSFGASGDAFPGRDQAELSLTLAIWGPWERGSL